jgi:hypothetical protein
MGPQVNGIYNKIQSKDQKLSNPLSNAMLFHVALAFMMGTLTLDSKPFGHRDGFPRREAFDHGAIATCLLRRR